MKKQLLLIFILGWCLCCGAQEPDTVKLITPFGKPDGTEVSSKMDKEGGTAVSRPNPQDITATIEPIRE